MAKARKATIHDLSPDQRNCPVCGNAYTPVAYYTGKLISYSSTRTNLSNVQTEKKYASLVSRTGGVCLPCARQQDRNKVIKNLLITIIGGLLMFSGFMTEISRIKYGGTGNGILLVALGGMLFLCGLLSVIINLCGVTERSATMNSLSMFNFYVDRLTKDGNDLPGMDYIPPHLVKKQNHL